MKKFSSSLQLPINDNRSMSNERIRNEKQLIAKKRRYKLQTKKSKSGRKRKRRVRNSVAREVRDGFAQ